jgi:hypothetical protein
LFLTRSASASFIEAHFLNEEFAPGAFSVQIYPESAGCGGEIADTILGIASFGSTLVHLLEAARRILAKKLLHYANGLCLGIYIFLIGNGYLNILIEVLPQRIRIATAQSLGHAGKVGLCESCKGKKKHQPKKNSHFVAFFPAAEVVFSNTRCEKIYIQTLRPAGGNKNQCAMAYRLIFLIVAPK